MNACTAPCGIPLVRALALALALALTLPHSSKAGRLMREGEKEKYLPCPVLLGRIARSIQVGIQSNVEHAGEPRQLVSVCCHYYPVEIQVGLLGLPLPHL